jgi:predicted transcriptional regulator
MHQEDTSTYPRSAGSVALDQYMRTHTANSIAAIVGCSHLQVRNWRHGRSCPTIKHAAKLEALVGIPIVAWVRPAHVEARAPTGVVATEVEATSIRAAMTRLRSGSSDDQK